MSDENISYLKKGILWNSASQFGLIGVQLLATVLLGRILTPDDYGILGMMSIFVAIANMIVDSGMGGALVKKKDVTYKDYSTLFLYNLSVSLFLYLMLFCIAPYIAAFYERLELTKAIRILGLTVVIYAFCITQNVRMVRNMKFRTLAIINCSSGLISLVVAVFVAMRGGGYWALIIQQLVTSFCNTLFLSIHNKFMPSFVFSKVSFQEQFKFGINLISANLLRTLSENINSNVIAKIVPLQQVGCFVQANRLINYYNSVSRGIIDKSVFPVFARIEDKSELLYNYIKIERYLLSITFSICVLMSLLSSQIIVILLGVQWKEASWMFELLVFSIMPVAIQILNRNILKSLGNTRQILNNELIKSGITLLFLFLGVIFSLSGVICGFVVSQVLSAIWIMRSIAKELEYSIYEQLKLVLSYVLPNLMVYFIIKIVIYYMPIEGMFGEAIMKIGLWFVVTLALTFIFRQYEWINMLKVLRRKMLYRK